MPRNKQIIFLFILMLLVSSLSFGLEASAKTDSLETKSSETINGLKRLNKNKTDQFDGEEAYNLIAQLLSYGPRYATAPGHKQVQTVLSAEMKRLSHQMIVQGWRYTDASGTQYEMKNIIGRFWPMRMSRVILGSHYDSKRFADKDKTQPRLPVPGANDSASGVAVLLEIARLLQDYGDKLRFGIDLVFFDGEEGEEDLEKANWQPIGSIQFVRKINRYYQHTKPIQGIVIDMVCDKNLKIYQEGYSTKYARQHVSKFWQIAEKKKPSPFIKKEKYFIRDDHFPLNIYGIPSFLIIGFEYPYFHTTKDTLDKCSVESLSKVGSAIWEYLHSL